MRRLVQLALGLLIVARASGAVNSGGVKCLEVQCPTFNHCNDYSNQCEACSSVCDETGSNYQQEVCNGKCQAYVRHMLQKQYNEFRGDLERLWTLVTIAIVTACLSLLGLLWIFARRLARWNKLHGPFHRAFTGNWMKRNSTATANNNNSNNNNSHRHRETQSDAEMGTTRQNGLILMMPSISASVAPSRNDSGNVSGNSSGSRSGSGSATGIANNTPNTTITSLSRRHPSEDTTLDYAYDNPAMTPSPEAVQLRTNRESSF